MRTGIVGGIAAVLGIGALGLAVLVPSGSSAPVAELAGEEAYDTVVTGDDVTFLDPVTLEQRAGEVVSVSLRVRGRAADEDPDTVVRRYETTIRAADGTLLSATTTTTACLDRRTAEAVDCSSEAVDGRRTDVRGLMPAFPPDTPAQDRMMWDGTAQASFPVRFVGGERFRGLEVQRYEQVVPEQVVRSVTVPGALVGSPEGTTPAELVYGASRVLRVEPVSGVVVSVDETPLTRLRAPDGSPGAVLLGGSFRSSEESVTDALARARQVADRREGSGEPVRWVTGSAGVVLLAGASWSLAARGRALPARRVRGGAVRQPVRAG